MWERLKLFWYRIFHPQPTPYEPYTDPNGFDDFPNPVAIDPAVGVSEAASVGLIDLVDTASVDLTDGDFGSDDSNDAGTDFSGDSGGDFGGDSSS